MKRSKFELVLATILFLIGVFLLIFSQKGATGAAVGVAESLLDIGSITSVFVGLILVFSAVVLFASAHGRLETIVGREEEGTRRMPRPLKEVADYITHTGPTQAKRVLVLDMGVFINHKNIIKLGQFLDTYDKIYTTHEVFNNINNETKNLLRQNGCKLLNETFIENNSSEAEKYLGESEKAKIAKEILPYFRKENPKKPESRREMNDVMEKFKDLLPRVGAASRGVWGLNTASEYDEHFRSDALKYLEKCCLVSPGDIELMTISLKALENDKDNYVFVYARDSHIGDAIQSFKSANPGEKDRLHYVEV